MNKLFIILTFALSSGVFLQSTCIAQGFGRNKPKYKNFDFEVYETKHFDIYHYFKNKEALNRLAVQSEIWYDFIQWIAQDTIEFKNPVVFYAGHADFQQTNTISSSVGVTTGGVTEAFKNRVTMPITVSNQKTFQVLGHELVHAFQFDMIIRGDSTTLQNLANLPLFMVEGMAEYITRGRIDPHTSMWMRDIVLNDAIPELDKMQNPRYFPYRYGQAFWSVMAARYGDAIMPVLIRATAQTDIETAVRGVLGIPLDSLSTIWKNDLTNHFSDYLFNDKEDFIGRRLIDDSNAGNLNLNPAISPNGRYVIFLSEKGIFTTELFLADTRDGKVIRKIASTIKDNDFDNLNAFESSGTWSPDSKMYAFTGFSKGNLNIYIKEVENAKFDEKFELEDMQEINNLSWSPDGRKILFTGIKDGEVDLFTLEIRTGRVAQLTENIYSELQPQWRNDGEAIAFSTDELSMSNREAAGPWYHNLAILDLNSGETKHLNIFPFSDNLNPIYDEEDNLWFLSDRDGYRNLYKYELESDSLFQQTEFMTGISGITPFSPAVSIASKTDRVVYTHYDQGKYTLYSAREKAFLRKPVKPNNVNRKAGTLPGDLSSRDQVNVGLATLHARGTADPNSFTSREYKPKLTLDIIQGNAGLGVANGLYGTQAGAAGGIQALMSDMLGDHTVGLFAAINGELEDAGLGGQYINRKGRIHWGVGISHAPPQRLGIGANQLQPTNNPDVFTINDRLIRVFQDELSLLASYPISQKLRIEGNISSAYRYYSDREYQTFVTDVFVDGNGYVRSYRVLGQEIEKTKHNGEDFQVPVNLGGQTFLYDFRYGFLNRGGIAIVGDNSYFGMASPLAGHRFRIGADHFVGLYDFTATTIDVRKYFWAKPISVAVRGFNYNRFGDDANAFNPLYIGWQGFVRGLGGIGSSEELFERYGLSFNQLQGSSILMGQAEVRLPFTGPKQLAVIKSRVLFTELAAFFDVGSAFDDFDDIVVANNSESAIANRTKSVLFMTAGLSMRVNLFGALILEPYYAFPIRENSKGAFGLNFLLPGW